MTEELPPYDSSPDNLLDICKVLREGGLEKEDLLEEVEMSETTVDQTVEYGIFLGFIESEDEEVVTATSRGQQYGYGNLPASREHSLFRDAIREYETYQKFFEISESEVQEINDEEAISRDGITRELRIRFDYEVGDRVLESVANTFLKTLDSSGLGNHKTGRKGYPTRLVVGDDYWTFLSEMSEQEDTDNSESEEQDSDETQQAGLSDISANTEEKESDPVDNNDESDELSYDEESHIASHQENQVVGTKIKEENTDSTLEVQIEISSSDWESEEVIEVIQALKGENDDS